MLRGPLRSIAALALSALALSLALGACGGDDEGEESGGGDVESFCVAIDEVKAAGQALAATPLESDDDVPEAKAALLELIAAFDAAVEAAPEEIRAEADQITGLTAQVEERVSTAETAQELRDEIPLLVSVLAENTDVDKQVSTAFIEFVQERCGA